MKTRIIMLKMEKGLPTDLNDTQTWYRLTVITTNLKWEHQRVLDIMLTDQDLKLFDLAREHVNLIGQADVNNEDDLHH